MKFIKYFDAGVDNSKVKEFSEFFGISEKVMKIIVNRGYDTKEKAKKEQKQEKLDEVEVLKETDLDNLVSN